MVKKSLIFFTLFINSFAQSYENGNYDKGLTYYKFLFRNELRYSGVVFTHKYTASQWEKLFENNAKKFKQEFSGISSTLDSLLQSEKFERIAPDLKAFTIYYAKDSGYSPQCGNKVKLEK